HDVNQNDEFSTEEIIKKFDEHITGKEKMIILSGAEITVRKDLFYLLENIKKRNNHAQVFLPSNGRMFYYKNYVKKLKDLGIHDLKVTVSILGNNAETHESVTLVKNSFKQSYEGIKNLLRYLDNVNINVTILKKNYKELPNICKTFLPMGIRSIQLAIVEPNGKAAKNFKGMIPKISELRPYILKSLKVGEGKVKTKNIPPCVLGIYKDLRYFETQSHLKEKPSKCNLCEYCDECSGFWREYFRIYGEDEIRPIRKVKNG
ncbi:MAG: radical SAM protein, partial [Nanobdellota archaeon]